MFFIFFIMLICAAIGGAMAVGRGRNFVVWAIICFFTGLIGIILLALMGAAAPAATPALAVASQPATAPNKWATLVELDPEIAAAAAEARKYGTACETLLAEKYLALNDKQYLAAALDRATEPFRVTTIPELPLDRGETTLNGAVFHYKVNESGGYLVTKGPFTGQIFASYQKLKEFYLTKRQG